MPNEIVYLVILEDRHLDAQIRVCEYRPRAFEILQEFMDGYQGRYQWFDRPIPGWLRHMATDCDDGPKIRIEEKMLE